MPSALRASAIRERGVVRSQASYITSCALAVASSPRRPAIAARKLSIARLSGNAAAALVFVEVFEAVFRARLLRDWHPLLLVPIFVSPGSYGCPSDAGRQSVTRWLVEVVEGARSRAVWRCRASCIARRCGPPPERQRCRPRFAPESSRARTPPNEPIIC